MKGIAYIISAPSGAGKTTLCRMAAAHFPEIRNSVSYTTRKPRPGEVNGRDYWFIDDETFDRMVAAGEFLEHAGVYGRRYGTSRKDLEALLEEGFSVILEIDVQGAASIRKTLKGGVYIFILPPSLKACEQRLVDRGKDSPEDIRKRLKIAEEEIKSAPSYDYLIVNDDLGRAFEDLKAVMMAQRAASMRMEGRLRELFGGILKD
ncbi:MAG: guanylate kinase [Deltaproteobacteria bacterium]|nr:guanylate kinase [Deltaproteobacteria bacterium]